MFRLSRASARCCLLPWHRSLHGHICSSSHSSVPGTSGWMVRPPPTTIHVEAVQCFPLLLLFRTSWMHVRAANRVLKCSRSCQRNVCDAGLVKQVATMHSILLCTVLPPVGFLSHIFTCFFVRKRRGGGSTQNPGEWPAPSPEAGEPPPVSA